MSVKPSKLPAEVYDAAFKYCGVEKSKLKAALPKVKSTTKTRDRIIAEFLFFYVAPQGSDIMTVPIQGASHLHYYLEWPNETVVDLTLEDLDFSKIDYSKSKKFTKMGKSPSEEVRKLAEYLNYSDDDLDLDIEEDE
jgi:hypothetical protein